MDTTTAIPATSDHLRIGDADREKAASQLGFAITRGFLQVPEYDARLQRAYAATTAGELRQLLGDLPAQVRRHDPRRDAAKVRAARLGVRIHAGAYLAMVVIVLAVWLATAVFAGATYFWPVWPILGGLIGLISHATPVRMVLARLS